jgi:hypothetical protein
MARAIGTSFLLAISLLAVLSAAVSPVRYPEESETSKKTQILAIHKSGERESSLRQLSG